MKFEDYRIAEHLKRNLAEMGWKRPTDIQFKAIPNILKGEDVLAVAQTGTGKTAAYAIPVLQLVEMIKTSKRSEGIRCLVVVPTRELCLQIAGTFEKIGRGGKVKTMSVFGGVEQDPQILRLEKGIDILVSTPGRMFDLINQGFIELKKLDFLVLDEADQMLDLGFIKDVEDLMKHVPRERQTLFFSATINEKIKKLAYSLVKNAIRIQISPKDPVSKNVHHAVAFIGMDDKRFFLARLIGENPGGKFLVFVRTKIRAERVQKALERAEIQSITIHGDKEQKERFSVMKQFREGSERVLIATDVSARGIDIPNVDLVVNYDLPDVAENYVHRVGRTGRGVQKGRAISFCSKEEREMLIEIEAFLGNHIEVLKIDKNEYSETVGMLDDRPVSAKMKDLMLEIAEAEKWERKKRRK